MISYKQSTRFRWHGFPLVENRDEWATLIWDDSHKDQQQLVFSFRMISDTLR